MSTDSPLTIASAVVDRAEPGEEVEAYVVERRDVDIEVHDTEIESLSTAGVAGLGVRVIRDDRMGFAYAGSLDEETAAEVLAEARDNVAFGSEDPALGLPDPCDPSAGCSGGAASEAGSDLALVAPDFHRLGTSEKVELVIEAARALRSTDPRIRTVEAGYGDAFVRSAVANTRGLQREQERTISSLSAYAIVEDGGQTQTGFGYDLARDPADLDTDAVREEAADRSLRMLGATRPDSGRVPVVLDPFVAAALAGVVSRTLSGESVLKGRSIFGDRLGEAIASPVVTFFDDPTDPEAFGATRFDSEGVTCVRNEFVRDGVLIGFAHNTWTARRTGGASTGNAVRASYRSTPGVGMRSVGFVPTAGADLEALLRQADGGIYVHSVQGLHSGVNPVSGDFSVGAEGFHIRKGLLGEPFREATIASTIQRMLLDIVATGAQARMLSGGPAVHLLLGEMTLGGR